MNLAESGSNSTREAPILLETSAYPLSCEAMDCENVFTSSSSLDSFYNSSVSLTETDNLNLAVHQYNDEEPVTYRAGGGADPTNDVDHVISCHLPTATAPIVHRAPSLPLSYIASPQSIGSQSTTSPSKAGSDLQCIIIGDNDEKRLNARLSYASLIHKALESAPNKRFRLHEIYAWFEQNTDKCIHHNCQGFIRYNLTMNKGFKATSIEHALTKELEYWWHLTDEADKNGLQRTPRPQRLQTKQEMGPKTDRSSHVPSYADLIHEALTSAPGQKLTLDDIFAWFKQNTNKDKKENFRGCQKTIRHYLATNDVFDTTLTKDAGTKELITGGTSRGFKTVLIKERRAKRIELWWYLTDEAVKNGIQPTPKSKRSSPSVTEISTYHVPQHTMGIGNNDGQIFALTKSLGNDVLVPRMNADNSYHFDYSATRSSKCDHKPLFSEDTLEQDHIELIAGSGGDAANVHTTNPFGLTMQPLKETTGRLQMPEQTQNLFSYGYEGDSSHSGSLKPHELPGHLPKSQSRQSVRQDPWPPSVSYKSTMLNNDSYLMARPRSIQLSSATLSDVTPICPARSSRFKLLPCQQHLESPELAASGFSSFEDEKSLLFLNFKGLFEYIRTGHLREASRLLFEACKWLLTNSQNFGMPRDRHLSYSDLLEMWKKLDLCWLALNQKQQDLIEAYLRGDLSTQDILPRQDEIEAMEEVRRGIWEEKIIYVHPSTVAL
ncbi:uncharacterized protein N7484_008176 [Penicillium longicatenatum]|uniref:uncharacterized protein n=1 Tax=Penicillium longicatenatum TaxID=1561947 RepID=UPI002548BB2D|nr:uncharacterized protein N7484_008176 [Penicillium longicatenatum]KAJ5640314.1 hypothetical protein N7484_008176 [Penicillium longicatenatum]